MREHWTFISEISIGRKCVEMCTSPTHPHCANVSVRTGGKGGNSDILVVLVNTVREEDIFSSEIF